jgi:hypothetical protein
VPARQPAREPLLRGLRRRFEERRATRPLDGGQPDHSEARPAARRELKPVGKALAMGLATLAAETGLAWLRRRAEGSNRPSLPVVRGTKPAIPEPPIYQSFEEVHAWVREGDFERRIFAKRVVRSIRTTNPTDGLTSNL